MEEEKEHIDILIAKVALGEATPEEMVELFDCENLSDENRLYVTQGTKVFEQIAFVGVDTDAAWYKLKSRIDNEEEETEEDEKPVVELKPKRSMRYYYLAAAGFALIAMVSIFLKYFAGNTIPSQEYATLTENATLKDTLPDGSILFLNKHSDIKYIEEKGERHVKLKGEAYFEVKHSAEVPFIIEVNEVFIKDIGTAFNVKEQKESHIIEVWVESGVVDFYTNANKGITLKAGEKGVYNTLTKDFVKIEDRLGANAIAYKTKEFDFNNTKLGDVIMQLNAVYSKNIVLENEKLKNCPITVKFSNEDFDTIMLVITETLHLTATPTNGSIVLSGNGCN